VAKNGIDLNERAGADLMCLNRFNKYRNRKNYDKASAGYGLPFISPKKPSNSITFIPKLSSFLRLTVILGFGLTLQFLSVHAAETTRTTSPEESGKPHRLVVLTDIEADPDDTQSLVRLLLYSNEIDIRGLAATTSIHKRTSVHPDSIRNVIHAYAAVHDNLLKHDADYPTAESLLGDGSQSSRQDRVACGRAFSPSRFHCDEPSVEIEQCGEVLQQARHSRAVDQRRQIRIELDKTIVSRFLG